MRAIIVFGLLALCGCSHVTRPYYRDELVEVTEHATVHLLNVHGSTHTEILTIWGRDFKDVRGRKPCYLRIPERDMILFVTGRTYDGGQATVHLAEIQTKKIISFPAYDSHIGAEIGEQSSEWYERVLKLDGDLLVIEAASGGRKYQYYIDLKKPQFEKEEVDLPDIYPPHHLIHQTHEGGKIMK